MPRGHYNHGPAKRYRKAPGRNSMVHIHRARAEAALGHALPAKAVVHHADGTRDDDGPLVICQDQAYHLELHRKMRIQAAGGNPWTQRLCKNCGVLPLALFYAALGLLCKVCDNARKNQYRNQETPA